MPDNPWKPSARIREPAQLMHPVIDAAAWSAKELERTGVWVYHLSDADVAEIHSAVASIEADNLELKSVTQENFPLPRLSAALADIKAELRDGRGLALIRGLPIEGRTRMQIAIAFWGLGHYMGQAKSQNYRGHLLGHVTDLGADVSKERGYMAKAGLNYHTDRADILSLCCIQKAKSGGEHRVCSSVTLYNEMLSRRPDLVQELCWPFYRSRYGEIPVGETQEWYRQPVFSVKDGYFAATGINSSVLRGHELPGIPDLTEAQIEAMKMFQALAPELALEVELELGDITFVNCHVTYHGRSDYDDWPEPDRKRHLLRLWLNTGGERPLVEEIAREIYGVVTEETVLTTPLDAV
jgi:hypothetical protein